MCGTGSKLSQLQKRVLRNLLAWVEHARGRENVASADMHAPVVWLRGRGSKARADSAAFSRAVVRLERRGLLVRSNLVSGIPTPSKFTCSPPLPTRPRSRRIESRSLMFAD